MNKLAEQQRKKCGFLKRAVGTRQKKKFLLKRKRRGK